MEHVKTLLQLHSVKLILLSALGVIFFMITAADKTHDTRTSQTDVSVGKEEARRLVAVDTGD